MPWRLSTGLSTVTSVRIFQVCTDVDVHGDTRHADAKRLDQLGKIDVNFATDMDAGFAPLTIMVPFSLKKPGDMQHQRPVN